MKKFTTIILSLLFAGSVQAQSVENDLVGLRMEPALAEYIASIIPGGSVLGNNTFLKGRNQANGADISILKVDATDDTVLNADSGDVIKFSVANTPIAAVGNLDASGFDLMAVDGATSLGGDATFASGKAPVLAVAIITPNTNMTPAASSNMAAVVNRFVAGSPTLAAANLPAASAATLGKEYKILNEGSYPVLVFPTGSDTIGAAAAGTPHSCATTKVCDCIGKSATAWQCGTK